MDHHPALQAGHAAVVTGGASGVGLAAAKQFARLGMRLVLADLQAEALSDAALSIVAEGQIDPAHIVTVVTDVSRLDDVQRLKETAFSSFGTISVLMNNAGIGARAGSWDGYDIWRQVLDVNLWGVINGVQCFAQSLIDQGIPAAIINTGSKQGITCPPGNTAYNVSKAGIKVLTEALSHSLRNTANCAVTAHLLVPGFTWTGMSQGAGGEKPSGAWTADQVAAYLIGGLDAGDFYILCPDNEVTRDIDHKRILWAAGDIVENRPALSRWHPDYKEAFDRFKG